jgi:hypothetical protein
MTSRSLARAADVLWGDAERSGAGQGSGAGRGAARGRDAPRHIRRRTGRREPARWHGTASVSRAVCRAADRGRLGGKCVQRQQGTQTRPALSGVRSTRTMRVVSSGYTRGDIINSGGAADALVATRNSTSDERLRLANLGLRRAARTAARRPGGIATEARRIRLAATTGQTPAAATGRGAAQ